jgi:peptidoglycan/LPS O-acetylase OafA/YrhL
MTVAEILKRDHNNLDLVRVIVATMVIWSHSFALIYGNDILEPIYRVLKITYAGELGVNIFFFISGLLVTNSILKKKSAGKFVISRFFRIFPALFVLIVVTVFIAGPVVTNLSAQEYFAHEGTWIYFIRNLYLNITYQLPGCFQNNIWPNDVNGSLWSLTFEVACYVFILSVFLLARNHKRLFNTVIAIILLLSIIPNRYLLAFFDRSYIIGTTSIACFAFGALFAVNQDRIKVDYKLFLGLCLLVLLSWRYVNVIRILFPFTISVFMLYFSTDKYVMKLRPRYDISYGLYIWHFLIQQIIVYYCGAMNVYMFFMISLAITALVSLLSFILVEERSINYGYKLGNKLVALNLNTERVIVYFITMVLIIIVAKLL